jgi:hypothetical protein
MTLRRHISTISGKAISLTSIIIIIIITITIVVIITNIIVVINIVFITDNLANHFFLNRKISLPPVRRAV